MFKWDDVIKFDQKWEKSTKITRFGQISYHYSPRKPWFLVRMNDFVIQISWQPSAVVICSQNWEMGILFAEIVAQNTSKQPLRYHCTFFASFLISKSLWFSWKQMGRNLNTNNKGHPEVSYPLEKILNLFL